MKFINYLQSISGVGFYPLFSLFIFLLFFIAVAVYLLKAGKHHFDEVAQIPLDENQDQF
jgi:cytochrome c oxidase cbb3-type subunit 4